MPATGPIKQKLPRRFEDLVAMAPPHAIMDEVQYENVLETIDQLMATGKLSKGQELYLETLVQLVEAYEAKHHTIETNQVTGLGALRHLLAEHKMSGSDMARLLGIHASMGSKILNGDRALTVDHIRKLAAHFKVRPELFIA